MSLRRLTLLCLLFLLGFALYQCRPRPARVCLAPRPMLRLHLGRGTEADREALARAVAEACGLTLPTRLPGEPYLVSVDLLPAPGRELAVAIPVAAASGLLALLAPDGTAWRVTAYVGPAELGVPTSLAALPLPGRATAAVILTDLADQMTGAFCRRENCSIYAADGGWSKLWTREIESEAYWNLAWGDPPSRGWVRLAGTASWRPALARDRLRLAVSYRNTLATAAGGAGSRLPETGAFVTTKESRGREEYHWDPVLGLFVLGYGRTITAAPLFTARGGVLRPTGTLLPAGRAVAILADTRGRPRDLLQAERMVWVRLAGQTGFVRAGSVRRLAARPADLTAAGLPWLLPH